MMIVLTEQEKLRLWRWSRMSRRGLQRWLPLCRGTSARRSHADSTSGSSGEPHEDVVTPWNVAAKGPKGIDYGRVTSVFKSQIVDAGLIAKLEATAALRCAGAASGPPLAHHLVRRGIAFSHRDFDTSLDAVAAGKRAYLYTGRGPSARSMHIGHLIPFLLTQHLQRVLNLPLVVQITDDEKYLFRDVSPDKMTTMAIENIKDIIAMGLDPSLTFIFRNTEYMGTMYPTVLELQRLFTCNAVKNTFGFTGEDSVGKYAFAATQAAPCFVSAFPSVLPCKTKHVQCIVPCAIDQDPFFVLTRSVADRLRRPKPALLHAKFLPALKGATNKMSSSAEQHGLILVTDKRELVKQKIRKAFSGGRGTLVELQERGADLDADVAFQLLVFFCEDENTLQQIQSDYQSGRVSSGAVKDLASDAVSDALDAFQRRRAAVTDEDVKIFTSIRPLW